MPDPETSIVFEGVEHAFGDRIVLRGIDLDIRERRVGIVGANGSGKSTLARMINGLVIPDGGSVTVNGLNVRKHKRTVRRSVGFIFSDPDRQIIMPTVAEDIELSSRASSPTARPGGPGPAGARRLRARRSPTSPLTSCRAGEATARPGRCDGGGPQHPGGGRADHHARSAQFLMLRETFAGLDEQLVVLTHDLPMLDDFDRVIVLDDGRVVADDQPGAAVAYYRSLMSR